MATPKKTPVPEVSVPEVAVETKAPAEAPAPKDVKVFSLRQGKIDMGPDGVLEYRKTLMVSKAKADWLVDSFKGLIEIV